MYKEELVFKTMDDLAMFTNMVHLRPGEWGKRMWIQAEVLELEYKDASSRHHQTVHVLVGSTKQAWVFLSLRDNYCTDKVSCEIKSLHHAEHHTWALDKVTDLMLACFIKGLVPNQLINYLEWACVQPKRAGQTYATAHERELSNGVEWTKKMLELVEGTNRFI